MTALLVTTCTADKDPAPGLLPAVQRYRGARIAFAVAEAERRGLPLLVLSGRYGLLAAGEGIPWYDEALQDEGVAGLVPAAAERLRGLGATAVTLVAKERATPGWAPYHAVLERACAAAGAALTVEVTELD